MDRTLHILTGFTAVGKTELSLDWAERHDAEIVNCDSLLFYRLMDIGTAKPSMAERERVPHHLIDIIESSNQYTIYEYVETVRSIVEDVLARGKRVLVVGGSGFYLQSFLGPVVDSIQMDANERRRIEKLFEERSLEKSVEQLRSLNPAGLGQLDTANPRRVLNAWLRCVASGKTLVELSEQFASQPGAFDAFSKQVLLLSRPRNVLEERVRRRVKAMIDQGLVEEVQNLLDRGIRKNPSAARAIGYRETIEFLERGLSEKELVDRITRNTCKLLKKQRTWFKKYLPVEAVYDVTGSEQLPDAWHLIPARTTN